MQEELYKKLKEVLNITDSALDLWCKTPNRAFSGLTPQQVVDQGREELIHHMIYYLESGQPG